MFPFLTLRAVPVGLNQCPVTCFSHQHSASLKFNKLCIKVGEIIPAEHFDIEVFQVQSVRILQISTSALRFEKDVHFVGGPGGEREKSHFSSAVMSPKNVLKSCISRSSIISNSGRCVLSRLKHLRWLTDHVTLIQAHLLLLSKFCTDTEHDINCFHRTFIFTCWSFKSVGYTTQWYH